MNQEFPVSQMAKSAEKPKKTQEELRAILEQKLKSQKPILQEAMKEYQISLENGIFEDGKDEQEGSGQARKEDAQKRIEILFGRAEKMKDQLDSKEQLVQFQSDLSATYTHPDGKQENITISFEQKFQEFIDLYQRTNLDLPSDFEDSIRSIWETNQAEMEQAIREKGFDEILIIPGSIPLLELSKKMKMEDGYGDYINSGGKTVDILDGANISSQNTNKPRIILVHNTQNLKDRPELEQTLKIKGKDVKPNEALSLEDYLVFQRKYFEKNQKHLDENGGTWLSTKSGSRLVSSGWFSGNRELAVYASDLALSTGDLGVRPSRCFS